MYCSEPPQVRARLEGLRSKVERDIDAALDPQGACRAAARGRWPSIWSKAKRMLGWGAGGGEGGAGGKRGRVLGAG